MIMMTFILQMDNRKYNIQLQYTVVKLSNYQHLIKLFQSYIAQTTSMNLKLL